MGPAGREWNVLATCGGPTAAYGMAHTRERQSRASSFSSSSSSSSSSFSPSPRKWSVFFFEKREKKQLSD